MSDAKGRDSCLLILAHRLPIIMPLVGLGSSYSSISLKRVPTNLRVASPSKSLLTGVPASKMQL